MKIVYVMETLTISGGLERIMVSKMNYLADKYGYDVTLIEVYDFAGEDAYKLSDNVHRLRLKIRKTSILPFKVNTFYHVIKSVKREILRLKPDVMSSSALLGVMLYAFSRYPCRMVYESHQARFTMPFQYLIRRMERNVDDVVCLTQGDAKEYNIARNVTVIENFNTVMPHDPKYKHRRSKNVVALGRLSKQKDFSMLLDIWHNIHHRIPAYTLHIVGDGPERALLQKKIMTLNLSESVVLSPATKDVDSIYRNADVFVMTSVFEGLPLVISEAMAYGVPVVSVDISYGPRDIISHGGGIITRRDVKEMSEAIVGLLSDDILYDKLSAEAPKVSSRYDVSVIMEQWKKFFS